MNHSEILKASSKIIDDRNLPYGDPMVNHTCAGELKEVFHRYFGKHRIVSNAERAAMDNVITKIARIATGPVVREDTYIDGAAYFAIAGSAASPVSFDAELEDTLIRRMSEDVSTNS